MERFVRFIIGGGITLLAGLWLLTLSTRLTSIWTLGLVAAMLGIGMLGAGICNGLQTPVNY